MNREELKSMFDALRNDPHHHLGLGDIRLTVAQQDLILDAIDDPLPPAEGAKEILQKYMDMSMIICPLHVVPRSVAIDAMTEVAALHAQRLAEKMVSEKAYNVIKEHYQSALAAKDVEKDYIDKYYYPKEFVEWLVKNSLPNDNELLIRTNLTKTECMTYDEAFNYWKENEQ